MKVILDSTTLQIVEDLIGCDFVPTIDPDQLVHVVDIEVADSPIADFAIGNEVLKSCDSLFQWNSSGPMKEIEVEMVCAESAQAFFARADCSAPSSVRWHHFAHYKNFFAMPFDCFAEQLFGSAVGVHLGRVDESETKVEAEPER